MRVLLVLTLLSATFFGQGLEGTSGTWKMNAARSTFAGGSPFKSLTVRIERHPKGEVLTFDRIETDGRKTSSSTILYLDGEPRRFEDFGCSGIQLSRRADGGDRAHVRQRRMDAVRLARLGQIERSPPGDHGAIRGWSPFRSATDAGEAIKIGCRRRLRANRSRLKREVRRRQYEKAVFQGIHRTSDQQVCADGACFGLYR